MTIPYFPGAQADIFSAAVSIVCFHETGKLPSLFTNCGCSRRVGWLTSSVIPKRPLTHNMSEPLAWSGRLPMTMSFFTNKLIWHPALHNGQVVDTSRSGLPSHLRVFSDNAPTGQTSRQVP